MNKFVVIDLETTGHEPMKGDRIIEVGMAIVEDGTITKTYSTFINPQKEIPIFIQNLTGISNQDVKNAPHFSETAGEVTDLFADSYFVAHNVPFDLGFLNAELHAANKPTLTNPVLDTVELARILYPQAPGFKLNDLAQYFDIVHDDPHRAISDAFVTAKLLLKLINKLESLPFATIDGLRKQGAWLKSDLKQILDARYEALLFAPEENDTISSYQGLAFKKMPEEKRVDENVTTSFGDYMDAIYEEDGALENTLLTYEKRGAQREMSEEIYSAFQANQHALMEAETGTGKSLAYLLAAVYTAAREQKRVIISTYTTQLQSQLLDEEIPLIQKLVPFSFKTALLKGKQHYISLEKFAHEVKTGKHENYDITLSKAMLLVWLTETDSGDVDEIQLPSNGYVFFRRISVEAEGHADPTSPWFHRSFYQHAKKQAQQANIVITNHSLLCTDMFTDYPFLPAYDLAIIDEAHHLEETASKHYGVKLDYASIHFLLTRIGQTDETGYLFDFVNRYHVDRHSTCLKDWNTIFKQAKYEADTFFRFLFQYVDRQRKQATSFSDIGRIQYRFSREQEGQNDWIAITDMASRLTFYLRDLIHILLTFKQEIDSQQGINKNDHDELIAATDAIQAIIDHLERLFLVPDETECVKWIEIEANGAKNAVYLYEEPLDMAKALTSEFFNKKKSVILTSATLTMKQSFTFVENRLGLEHDSIVTKKFLSPFSYQHQVRLMVPNDFPDVRSGDNEDYIYATCEAILSLADITGGRMLVLFTSYDMLRKAHYVLKHTLDLDNYMLMAQGISSGSRSRLKKNFIHYDHAILLGTSSFWEGVDIPGEDLSCLMIIRLPFEPPDHPIVQAKSEHFKQNSKNAFMELSLPNAVIRFKQGFGRLIRSVNDRGIVFVCDARLVKAKYGRFFTDSIPDVPISIDTTKHLIDEARQWF